jgi:hypothetical protein
MEHLLNLAGQPARLRVEGKDSVDLRIELDAAPSLTNLLTVTPDVPVGALIAPKP